MTPEELRRMQQAWLAANAAVSLPMPGFPSWDASAGGGPSPMERAIAESWRRQGRTQTREEARRTPPGTVGWGSAPLATVDLSPQGQNEPGYQYWGRQVANFPFQLVAPVIEQGQQFLQGMSETPAQAGRRRASEVQRADAALGQQPDLVAAFGGGGTQAQLNPFAGFRSTSGPGDARPGGRRHSGRDWAMPMNSPIIAPRTWRLLDTGSDARSGNWARVQFDDGSVHSFSHLSALPQQQFGTAGQPIALTGRTGNATGPSVHVRSWIGGREVDPGTYYTGAGRGQAAPGAMIAPLQFDASGYQQAQGMIMDAGRLAQQPMSHTWNAPAAPEAPAPTPIQPTDFSAVTSRLEAARPEGMTDRERVRRQRRGWLAGIARGLASVDLSASGGAGVGQLLAAVGSGALAGRAAADEDIDAREDLHDQQMREWNVLMANHETQKANDLAQTMRYNSEQAYQHSLRRFELAYREWEVQARPQISGGRIFTTQVNDDGTRTVNSAPIDNSALAGAMMSAAQIQMAIAAGQNEVGRANWQFNAAQVLAQAAQTQQPQDMATAIAIRVGEAIQSGAVLQAMSPDEFEEMSESAQAMALAQVPPTMTGSDADSRRLEIMQTQLIAGITARAMQDPQLRAVLMGASGQVGRAAGAANRYLNREVTTRSSQQGGRQPTVTSTIQQ